MSRDSTAPPPVDPRASIPEGVDERALRIALEGRELARDTLLPRVTSLEDELRKLVERVGRLPDPTSPEDKGAGLSRLIFELLAGSKRMEEQLAEMRRARAEEEDRAAKAREPVSRIAWLALGAGVAAVVGGSAAALLHWILTLHH